MSTCPYCGEEANTPEEEMLHMEDKHPDVVRDRLIKAGFIQRPDGTWKDPLVPND